MQRKSCWQLRFLKGAFLVGDEVYCEALGVCFQNGMEEKVLAVKEVTELWAAVLGLQHD